MHSSSLNIPLGYKFCPTEPEIVNYYLKRKILDQRLPVDIIPTFDVYGKSPNQLPLSTFKYGIDNEWYFFSTGLKRDNLDTIDGYWHPMLSEDIVDGDEIIGFTEIFVFYKGRPGTKTNWFMQEYRANPGIFQANELNDSTRKKIAELVICKFTRKEDDPERCLEVLGMEGNPARTQSNVNGNLQQLINK